MKLTVEDIDRTTGNALSEETGVSKDGGPENAGLGDAALKKSVRERVKNMPPRDRVMWFLDYYKIPLIAVTIGIIIVVSVIRSIVTALPDGFYAEFINARILDGSVLMDPFAEYAGIDTSKEICRIDIDPVTNWDANDQASLIVIERTAVRMAAAELDVIAADEEIFMQYAKEGTFADISDLLSANDLERLSPFLVEAVPEISEGVYGIPGYYGIRVEGSDVIRDCGAYPEGGAVIGVLVNTTRRDRAVKFIEYLFR